MSLSEVPQNAKPRLEFKPRFRVFLMVTRLAVGGVAFGVA
jgi:hypothetical protein